ncbi:EexN family lipoprotein [Helicobacter pullorum]|uniref:EexN family lipoprotein n=1 Tax=Helicobacter pullorum TaxID=35818 RepID=UPI000CF13009|nr:EexN family lipoprotein [Helicobacter pullorum]
MKNVVKISILSALVAGIFSACSSEPKSVQYYEDPKNAEELAEKIKECKKSANSEFKDDECANAYKAERSKSFDNPFPIDINPDDFRNKK